jgi:hypothetical protein
LYFNSHLLLIHLNKNNMQVAITPEAFKAKILEWSNAGHPRFRTKTTPEGQKSILELLNDMVIAAGSNIKVSKKWFKNYLQGNPDVAKIRAKTGRAGSGPRGQRTVALDPFNFLVNPEVPANQVPGASTPVQETVTAPVQETVTSDEDLFS